MTTLRLFADPAQIDAPTTRDAIAHAARILHAGGLVALPTETVYGLGANALNAPAVARIFAAKERPHWDPVIVHIAGPATANNPMLRALVTEIPAAACKLIKAFWPGPMTLLLPRSAAVPDSVTAGRPLVGIRMPAHPVALRLIEQAGVPIAAPSANRFGHISPTTAQHVLDDLEDRIDAILDAGPTLHGVESTVLDPTQSPIIVYRPGAITLKQIRSVAGPAQLFKPEKPLTGAPAPDGIEALPSPGVSIRHYAPKASLYLVEGPRADLPRLLAEAAAQHTGARLGLLLPTDFAAAPELSAVAAVRFDWGHWSAPEELAARLYSGLRALDHAGCTVLLCPLPPADGIGAALRDRLRKAAAQ
ncbi:MAG: L-threonylcarbamoyladenylate synthase [Terracidiphilus sp.]|nr:L-threonylcarbamoyladenylate synthase [Terracidiphilus sp.]